MQKRRTADEVTRLLRDFDRGLAKGLTIPDICRKVGVADVGCLEGKGSESIPVAARRRSENGNLESFHSRLRDERLKREDLESVAVAGEGRVLPSGVQRGAAAQLARLLDSARVQGGLRPCGGEVEKASLNT